MKREWPNHAPQQDGCHFSDGNSPQFPKCFIENGHREWSRGGPSQLIIGINRAERSETFFTKSLAVSVAN